MTQAKPKPTVLEWMISGAVLGGFAGAVLMFRPMSTAEPFGATRALRCSSSVC
jgi:hypothetical protein